MTRGWLNVQDPWTGEWFSIPYKEAPFGYARLAMRDKEERAAERASQRRTYVPNVDEHDHFWLKCERCGAHAQRDMTPPLCAACRRKRQ